MPDVTAGAFRPAFFFSFFGRIVSELGLARRLLIFTEPPAPPPTATWGIELTVSVSTIIFFAEPSPVGFPRLALPELKVLVVVTLDRNVEACPVADRILISPLLPPLSLPLSFAPVGFDFNVLGKAGPGELSCSDNGLCASSASPVPRKPGAGVLG